jgi:hypothetical protein
MSQSKYTTRQLRNRFSIDGLRDEIERRAGYKIKVYGVVADNNGRGQKIEFSSDSLMGHLGLLNQVMESCHLSDFGSGVELNEDGEVYAWVAVHFNYTNKRGGSNGQQWFDAYYNFDKKEWSFRS